MITIRLTNKSVETEAGPNFFWHGDPINFLKIVYQLHPLGVRNGVEVNCNKLENIKVLGEYHVVARSSNQGNILCKVQSDKIIIDLDYRIWQQVLGLMFAITFQPSHNFIEFDNMSLHEDANFIVSSEHVQQD